jgi:membrane fusion protein (multidrug efflux system)
MKKFALVLLLVAVVAIGWIFMRAPGADPESESEAGTLVAVRVAEVIRTTLHAYVTAYGIVEPQPTGTDPAASARIAPSASGVVVAVDISEGQRVAQNDILFRLDSRAADIAVTFAAATVAREQQLLAIEGTSAKTLEAAEQQLEAARLQQSLLRIRSPLAGTVTRVNVTPGTAVDPATVMAEIIALDRLIVSAAVPAAELGALAIGQPVQITADGSAATIAGSVDFIGAQLDAQTGTATVRTRLAPGTALRPGQRATLRIASVEHRDRLAVPVASVVRDANGASVIAIVAGDQATQMPVITGLQDGGLIEVDGDGLQAGMTVVTEGAYGLPATTRIRIVEN